MDGGHPSPSTDPVRFVKTYGRKSPSETGVGPTRREDGEGVRISDLGLKEGNSRENREDRRKGLDTNESQGDGTDRVQPPFLSSYPTKSTRTFRTILESGPGRRDRTPEEFDLPKHP